ncbi:MAG: hypothetical protein J0L53_19145 [Spirochaetes bacterium]|nr:hypothetical protein [Spirochaetota bacterium]
MNDLVILGIVLAGIMVGLFIWQPFKHKKSALGLKMFQLENTRLIQEWRNESRRSHEDNMEYLKGITGSLSRVIRKKEEGESGAK